MKVQPSELLETADELGLNAAILDDLLEFEQSEAAQARPQPAGEESALPTR
jgi:hypothetical protein